MKLFYALLAVRTRGHFRGCVSFFVCGKGEEGGGGGGGDMNMEHFDWSLGLTQVGGRYSHSSTCPMKECSSWDMSSCDCIAQAVSAPYPS